jgi:hypothetical protein
LLLDFGEQVKHGESLLHGLKIGGQVYV